MMSTLRKLPLANSKRREKHIITGFAMGLPGVEIVGAPQESLFTLSRVSPTTQHEKCQNNQKHINT